MLAVKMAQVNDRNTKTYSFRLTIMGKNFNDSTLLLIFSLSKMVSHKPKHLSKTLLIFITYLLFLCSLFITFMLCFSH